MLDKKGCPEIFGTPFSVLIRIVLKKRYTKSNVMQGRETEYLKRTQKDYSLSFKLSVVSEIERGEISVTATKKKYGIQGNRTVTNWLKKYGTFNWENQTPSNIPRRKDQKILEVEQKIKLLEKQKVFLEKQAENADKKAIFFDMMIDMVEKKFHIPIRKNSLPGQSNDSQKTTDNRISISCTCGLLGFSRQVYYRSLRSKGEKQIKAEHVLPWLRLYVVICPASVSGNCIACYMLHYRTYE